MMKHKTAVIYPTAVPVVSPDIAVPIAPCKMSVAMPNAKKQDMPRMKKVLIAVLCITIIVGTAVGVSFAVKSKSSPGTTPGGTTPRGGGGGGGGGGGTSPGPTPLPASLGPTPLPANLTKHATTVNWPVGGGFNRSLDIQEGPNMCYAATTATIMRFMGAAQKRQCEIATENNRGLFNVGEPHDFINISIPPECAVPNTLCCCNPGRSQAVKNACENNKGELQVSRYVPTFISGTMTLSWTEVKSKINSNQMFAYGSPNHWMTVYGYSYTTEDNGGGEESNKTLLIWDPLSGKREETFSDGLQFNYPN